MSARKTFRMVVTVTADARLSPAHVRREVRTRVNEGCHYLSSVPGTYDELNVAVRKIEGLPA